MTADLIFTTSGVRLRRRRQDAHFDHSYRARWWPSTAPTLVLAGQEDHVVWQGGWDAPRFGGGNVVRVTVEKAGHFPWIENPEAVRDAFAELAQRVLDGAAS
jgi:pimeloyl-ACP methyl ester carboxylesterase